MPINWRISLLWCLWKRFFFRFNDYTYLYMFGTHPWAPLNEYISTVYKYLCYIQRVKKYFSYDHNCTCSLFLQYITHLTIICLLMTQPYARERKGKNQFGKYVIFSFYHRNLLAHHSYNFATFPLFCTSLQTRRSCGFKKSKKKLEQKDTHTSIY